MLRYIKIAVEQRCSHALLLSNTPAVVNGLEMTRRAELDSFKLFSSKSNTGAWSIASARRGSGSVLSGVLSVFFVNVLSCANLFG